MIMKSIQIGNTKITYSVDRNLYEPRWLDVLKKTATIIHRDKLHEEEAMLTLQKSLDRVYNTNDVQVYHNKKKVYSKRGVVKDLERVLNATHESLSYSYILSASGYAKSFLVEKLGITSCPVENMYAETKLLNDIMEARRTTKDKSAVEIIDKIIELF